MLAVGPHDVVLGVSASGSTPYTLGAIDQAKAAGSLTIGLACVPGSEGAVPIVIQVNGPSFLISTPSRLPKVSSSGPLAARACPRA